MIMPALFLTSTKAEAYRRAIVAVRLASTPAFTPLPNPSERTEISLASSWMRRETKTSPETTWPALARLDESTSIKLSPVILGLGLVRFFRGERLNNRVERDLRFRRILSQKTRD